MTPLYTEEEFLSSKNRNKLLLKCENCSKSFFSSKREIVRAKKNSGSKRCCFCCQKCYSYKINGLVYSLVDCKQCKKQFKKFNKEIKRSPNNFCSRSCAATYNNTHKTKGTRVSKLERYLQKNLPLIFPDLKFEFNKKNVIGSELDIYIPCLKLAIELNGIFHYKPIFGEKKLKQIKNNDKKKQTNCLKNNITLKIVDVSELNHYTDSAARPYLDYVKKIIIQNLNS